MKAEFLYLQTDIKPITIDTLLDFGWRKFQHAVMASLLIPYRRISSTPHQIEPHVMEGVYVFEPGGKVMVIQPGADPTRFFSCGFLTHRTDLEPGEVARLLEKNLQFLAGQGFRPGLKAIVHIAQEDRFMAISEALNAKPLMIADYIIQKNTIFSQHPVLAKGPINVAHAKKRQVGIRLLKEEAPVSPEPAADAEWGLEEAVAYI